jgi:hypothetical protein
MRSLLLCKNEIAYPDGPPSLPWIIGSNFSWVLKLHEPPQQLLLRERQHGLVSSYDFWRVYT